MLKKWEMVEEAWVEAEKSIQSGQWDLVVLDDINYAISDGTMPSATACSIGAKVVDAHTTKPEMVHVILTGRNAHPRLSTFRTRSRKCAR